MANNEGSFELIDGQQRLTTISAYLEISTYFEKNVRIIWYKIDQCRQGSWRFLLRWYTSRFIFL